MGREITILVHISKLRWKGEIDLGIKINNSEKKLYQRTNAFLYFVVVGTSFQSSLCLCILLKNPSNYGT